MKRELDHCKNRVEETAHNLLRLMDQNLALLENENHYAETIKSLRAAIARKDEALKQIITKVNLHTTFICAQGGDFNSNCAVCIAKRALESNL